MVETGRLLTAPVIAYIALGANLGDPIAAVEQALLDLGHLPATQVLACSSLYRTAPVDCAAGQDDYVNAVAKIATALEAPALLAALHGLEAAAGREREVGAARNQPRVLDLDLLAYGHLRVSSPELTLPHPRLHLRAFVLVPLLEIEPHLALPSVGLLAPWLQQCKDQPISEIEIPALPNAA